MNVHPLIRYNHQLYLEEREHHKKLVLYWLSILTIFVWAAHICLTIEQFY